MAETITIAGISFISDSDVADAMRTYQRGHPLANDTGLYGSVPEIEAFARWTHDKKRLCDVGACHGMFSLLFTARPGTSAIAIEPSPWAFPILQRNIALNPSRQIAALNCFAGEQTGRQVPTSRCWHHVVADEGGGPEWQTKWYGKPLQHEQLTIAETRIDDLPQVGEVDAVKIDVEGWECHVIRGAKATLARCRPLIFLEAHTNTLPGHGESGEGLLTLLRDLGYRFERPDGTAEDTLTGSSMKRLVCIPQ